MSETKENTGVRSQELEDLKPCANCGGENLRLQTYVTGDVGDVHSVICLAVRCRAQSGIFKTKEEAIDAWNRRAAPAWVMEPPTEEGFYWLYAGGRRLLVELKNKNYLELWVRVGRIPVSDIWELKRFVKTYPESQWQKINVPALPGEGENE